MQQPTSRQLYAYWDGLRNGRIAPRRFEVDPARISKLLGETFIAECTGLLEFRFRLAGTKICDQFGRELRGVDFLGLWSLEDRDAMASLVRNVQTDGAVAHGVFHGFTRTHRKASFEFTLMPLIHTDLAINRLLGAITAIEPPFWLGTEPLVSFEIAELHLHWPDGAPAFMTDGGAEVIRLNHQGFRVVEGGLPGQTD